MSQNVILDLETADSIIENLQDYLTLVNADDIHDEINGLIEKLDPTSSEPSAAQG
ncbi:hypothetical protein ACT3UJ_07020 [Halomonas sp. 86]|uniref:hypothetical protein n=1 Tax=unclassified Halomonas TaxID=2609666 RepID=UPI004033C33D